MKKIVYFLMICIAGILFSCSEDDLSKSNNPHDHVGIESKMNKVSLQEMKNFLKEQNKGLFPKSIDASLNKDASIYITKIDSTQVVQITYGDITTFTLYVETLDKENYAYSNLVLKYYNGELKEYVFHYNPTVEWQSAHAAGEKLPYDGELIITDIYGEETQEETGKMSGCMLEVRVACYGDSCPCTDGNGQTFYITVPCGGGGGGEGGGTTPTTPTPGGFDPADGSGGGGGNNTAFDYFIMDLNNAQLAWLTTNTAIMSQVYNYLQLHGQPNPNGWYDNDEAVQFALELVELLTELDYVAPNYNSSNYPGKEEGMPFNWWKNNYWLDNNFALDPYDPLNGLTQEEKILVFIWPEQAYKMFKNKPIAEATTISVMGHNGRNDKSDAFRHAFFNAINTRDIWGGFLIKAADIVRLFGKAHESEVPSNLIKEKIMDLHNNDVGINYTADIFSGSLTNNQVSNAISYFLTNGSLWYLSPLTPPIAPPNFGITSQTQLIPTSQ